MNQQTVIRRPQPPNAPEETANKVSKLPVPKEGQAAKDLQEHSLSLRIGSALKDRIEKTRILLSARLDKPVSMSEAAKALLEGETPPNREMAELVSEPLKAMRQIRDKIDFTETLTQPEWYLLAYFAEKALATAINRGMPMAWEFGLAILEAFRDAYRMRVDVQGDNPELDTLYLWKLQIQPMGAEFENLAVREKMRVLFDCLQEQLISYNRLEHLTWLISQTLVTFLEREELHTVRLHLALHPCGEVLFCMAARGYYLQSGQPVTYNDIPAALVEDQMSGKVYRRLPFSISTSFLDNTLHLHLAMRSGPDLLRPEFETELHLYTFPEVEEFRLMLEEVGEQFDLGGRHGFCEQSWKGHYFTASVREEANQWCVDVHFGRVGLYFIAEKWETLRALFTDVYTSVDFAREWLNQIRQVGSLLKLPLHQEELLKANSTSKHFFVVSSRCLCPHCQIQTKVFGMVLPAGRRFVNLDARLEQWKSGHEATFLQKVKWISSEAAHELQNFFPKYRIQSFGPTRSGAYFKAYLNHCEHCDNIIDDSVLHAQGGMTFSPSSAEKMEIRRFDIPIRVLAKPAESSAGSASQILKKLIPDTTDAWLA